MKKFNEWLNEAGAYIDDDGKWHFDGKLPSDASAFSHDEIEDMLPKIKGTNDKARITLPKPNTQNHQDRQDLVKFRQVAEDSIDKLLLIASDIKNQSLKEKIYDHINDFYAKISAHMY